jgi:hypothetical protein
VPISREQRKEKRSEGRVRATWLERVTDNGMLDTVLDELELAHTSMEV